MATESKGGYSNECVSPPPNDYECPICQMLLCEPLQIAKCGHRFCKACLEPEMRKDVPLCPLDRDEIEVDKVFTDQACHRAIQSLIVKCLNASDGCEWTGEIRDALEHQNVCPHERVQCTNENCEEVLPRQEIEKHSQNSCQWRGEICEYCNEKYSFFLGEEHKLHCSHLPIECVNGCDYKEIPRHEMAKHIADFCPLTVVECSYSKAGCNIKMKRSELPKHLDLTVQTHLDLAYSCLTTMEHCYRELASHMEKNKALFEDIQDRLSELERQPTKYDGRFLWKINKYSHRLAEAKNGRNVDIYSDPFYTGRYGYKLKCCVTLNGDGDAKDKYISIFLIIMRGKYDALLPWPYSNRIKFVLIDQKRYKTQRKNIIMDIVPDVTLEGYQRPKSERNPGVGIWKFAAHDVVENEGYVVGDEMFIKCEVEPFDILQHSTEGTEDYE
ncbi:TNF receptor-associated factor 5-like [Actinia tenebrosa]|uniref:TNF receptor-associated factor 5-like n=1 Tax=Actinia tenebrosa TaxID=6105 RepID=A0A6P8HEA9_ACTTE|nr:TNF receptor-associated factor 5-like [Actinia tenebrosa]